ncbi:MAG: DnaJ domain-containing protein, partial [Fimbriimonadaceae bacterium]
MANFYQILGLHEQSGQEEIRHAYRRLAHKYHPDRNPDPQANEHMSHINEAYDVLNDPDRRREYDHYLRISVSSEFLVPAAEDLQPVRVDLLHSIKAHSTPVYSLVFLNDSKTLVTSAFDNEIRWWNAGSADRLAQKKLEGGSVSHIMADPHDVIHASGSSENQMSGWSLSGRDVNSWRNNHGEWAACVAISPMGDRVAIGCVDKRLILISMGNGSLVHQRDDHKDSITAIAWSTDGKYIATGSADCSVKLWYAGSGIPLGTFRPIRSTVSALAFSPDGRFLAVAGV